MKEYKFIWIPVGIVGLYLVWQLLRFIVQFGVS